MTVCTQLRFLHVLCTCALTYASLFLRDDIAPVNELRQFFHIQRALFSLTTELFHHEASGSHHG